MRLRYISASILLNFCWASAELYPKLIRTASDAADFFQYSYEPVAWSKVIYCMGSSGLAAFAIDKCENTFGLHSLLQQTHSERGVFFECHSTLNNQTDGLKEMLKKFDSELNYYGLKVAEGPNCKDDCSTGPPRVVPARGNVVLMFAEKDSGVSYTKDQIAKIISVYESHKSEFREGHIFIALNLNYLAHSDVQVVHLLLKQSIILYQFEGQSQPDMNLAKSKFDQLIQQGAKINYMLSMDMKLRLESELPSAAWTFWRTQPLMQISTMAMLMRFLESPRRLVELRTRECDCGAEDPNYRQRLAVSRTECVVMLDFLLVQMMYNNILPLLECPSLTKCRKAFFKFHINRPQLPFVLVNLVNGPNSNGSATNFLTEDDAQAQVHYVIGFQERPGSTDKYYNKKHIDDLVVVIKKNKFKFPNGVHLRLDFLAKEKLADSAYFKPLLDEGKFGYLFVHDGEGFSESADVPATKRYTCAQLNNIKYNIRKINRETFLLVEDDIRGKLFIKTECGASGGTGSPLTPPTLPTKTTLIPTSTLPPIGSNMTFPVISGESDGTKLLPLTGCWTIILMFSYFLSIGIENLVVKE